MKPESTAKVDKFRGPKLSTRFRGRRFSMRHPKGEPGGTDDDGISIGEAEAQGLRED